jgi:hypothetical protein
MMFRARRSARGADLGTPQDPAGQILRDAQEIVRGAWKLELLRQRDHLRFALSAAGHDCDAAYEALAAAQRDGDPRRISVAHDALERSLEAARESATALELAHQTLRAERDLSARGVKKRAATAVVHRPGHDGTAPIAQPSTAPSAPTGAVRSILVVLPSKLAVPRWIRRMVVRRSTALEQP